MAEETKTEKKRSRLIFRIISRTAVVLAIAGCTISIVSNQSSIAEKKTELEQVQKQIDYNVALFSQICRRLPSVCSVKKSAGICTVKPLDSGSVVSGTA